MKIVVIGGGSFSTPSLLQYLDAQTPGRMELILASRSRERLAAISRASHLLVGEDLQIRTEPIETDNWQKILDGADSVVIQIRVGGFDGRRFDETFPNKYGLCGDEGLGPSALSVGWRTWPVLAPILEAIAKFCPRATVILLTSPLSLLVRAACKHVDLSLVGICELPWTTLQELSFSLGLQSSEVQADYLGVNHLGWLFNIRSGSRALGDELARAKRSFPTNEFLRTHGCFPTRYLRIHYETDKVLAEQTSQRLPRAEVLRDVQNRSYQAYQHGQLSEIISALGERATPWYAQALGPLLLAMNGRRIAIPFFLSGQNGAYVPFLAPDDIIECQYHWSDGGRVRSRLTSTPQHVVENLLKYVRFERVATDAIMRRSARLVKESLSLHPWTRDHRQLQAIVDELVTANDAMLMVGV